MIKVVNWNIAKCEKPWRELVQMGADVALLQEAVPPPGDVMDQEDAALRSDENAGLPDIGPQES